MSRPSPRSAPLSGGRDDRPRIYLRQTTAGSGWRWFPNVRAPGSHHTHRTAGQALDAALMGMGVRDAVVFVEPAR